MQLRTPDYVGIYFENGNESYPFNETVKTKDVVVKFLLEKELLHTNITANDTPIKYISLRWNFAKQEKRTDNVKVFGDVWERAYCDLEWRGIVPDRMMPWVCAVSKSYDII